jgi:hypothetical protein
MLLHSYSQMIFTSRSKSTGQSGMLKAPPRSWVVTEDDYDDAQFPTITANCTFATPTPAQVIAVADMQRSSTASWGKTRAAFISAHLA